MTHRAPLEDPLRLAGTLRFHLMEIRHPTTDEHEAIRELAVLSFNVPPSWVREGIGPTFRPDRYLCAYEGGRLVATTRDIPMMQWFGGRAIPASGRRSWRPSWCLGLWMA